jgi:hypothetical protein
MPDAAPATPTTIDLTDARRLAHFLCGDDRGFFATSSAIFTPGTKDKHDWREHCYPYPQALDFALDQLADLDAAGRDVYLGAYLYREQRNLEANVLPPRALIADVDSGSVDGLAPSALLETSPGRTQAIVSLTRPIEPARAKQLNQRLALYYGADPSGADHRQVIRVPGTHNRSRPGSPLVRLVLLDEQRRYDPDDLDRLLPPLPIRTAPAAFLQGGDAPPLPLDAEGLATWRGERPKLRDGTMDRNASLTKIAGVLYDAGLAPRLIAAELAERDETLGWGKFTARPDAEARYAAIVDAVCKRSPRLRQRATAQLADPVTPPEPAIVPACATGCELATSYNVVAEAYATAMQRVHELDEENLQLKERESAIRNVLRNKHLGQRRLTLLAAAFDVEWQRAQGRPGNERGAHRIWLPQLTATVGVSDDRASKHLKELAALDCGLEHELDRDPGTGKTHVALRFPDGPLPEMVRGFVTYAPVTSDEPKTWGGERRCPDHPDAAIVEEQEIVKVARRRCSVCHRLVHQSATTIEWRGQVREHPPQDAGHTPPVEPMARKMRVVESENAGAASGECAASEIDTAVVGVAARSRLTADGGRRFEPAGAGDAVCEQPGCGAAAAWLDRETKRLLCVLHTRAVPVG